MKSILAKPLIAPQVVHCEVLIIGAGIGGLTAAHYASEQGLNTLLMCKGKIAGGASFFPLKATLGIQVTANEQDKLLFREDILRVARQMNDPELVDTYIAQSSGAITALRHIGFSPWLRNDNRPACFARYPRDIWLINNWSEARKNCRELLAQHPKLTIYENSYPVRLLTENNQIQGAIIYYQQHYIYVQCAAVILATGGVAGLYQHNLYPPDVIGSGHSLALDAGASLVNMEFIQFIPSITTPKYKTLFGEHTLKYCQSLYSASGEDVFDDLSASEKKQLFDERSDYAPFSCDFPSHHFDITLQEYINQGQTDGLAIRFHPALYQDNGEFYRVYLDWLKNTAGIDLMNDEVKIAPFAHSCNGGIKIDKNGQSQVAGLFAVGEIASAIEGANRLGGNSVGGALVFAQRAINKISENAGNNNCPILTPTQADKQFTEFINEFKNSVDYKPEYYLQQARLIMMQYAGIIRQQAGLEQAIEKITDLLNKYNPLYYSFDLYYALRTAKLLLMAMHCRQESRGAHFRSDFPFTSSDHFRIEIKQQQELTIVKPINLGDKL